MSISLDDFERKVEPKIIERGFRYFRDGRVSRLEKVGPDEFSGLVCGNESYNVFIKLDGRRIAEKDCDCPYDRGDTCKHEVAVFYALKNGASIDDEIEAEIKKILGGITDEDLRAYFTQKLKKDWLFRNDVFKDFDSDYADYEDESHW
ncbi:MAG: SWIM zinc finger family protein [Pyrinomonadaceae bacterium]